MKKKKVCWGAFEGSCNSWYSGICVMSRPSHVSERSLQRSEFERAAHGFSRFPNALELPMSLTLAKSRNRKYLSINEQVRDFA